MSNVVPNLEDLRTVIPPADVTEDLVAIANAVKDSYSADDVTARVIAIVENWADGGGLDE